MFIIPHLGSGGAGRVVANLCNSLVDHERIVLIFENFENIIKCNVEVGIIYINSPAKWEGFPNALVEAMACGVPVISSDCRSGPREILAPNTDFNYQTQKPEFAEYGVLMPVFEVKYKTANEPLEEREIMWVETIDKLLEDGNLRKHYSERAKQRAEDFRIEKIVEEWNRCLINLMA